jgi:hypothetical protein
MDQQPGRIDVSKFEDAMRVDACCSYRALNVLGCCGQDQGVRYRLHKRTIRH